MAKQCCVCGKNIGFMERFQPLDNNDKYACDKCFGLIDGHMSKLWNVESMEQLERIKEQAEADIDARADELKNPQILKDYLNNKVTQKSSFLKKHEEMKESASVRSDCVGLEGDALYDALCGKLILTTAGAIEGYKVKKQLGVVFGETVFKPSVGQMLTSSVGDAFRSFAISSKEMKGQVSIIESARKFAYVKMMNSALERGANAIIAIDSDNTIGDSICYLSLYGTAVYVEPIE